MMQSMPSAAQFPIYTNLHQKQQRHPRRHLQEHTRKMKQKISITIDENTVLDIFSAIKTGKFRNKSHVVEYAVRKLLEVENG